MGWDGMDWISQTARNARAPGGAKNMTIFLKCAYIAPLLALKDTIFGIVIHTL